MLDAAYFARVDAIQFTIAHDDGIGCGGLGGGRYRARRRVALVEDADLDLSRQSRLQDRQHPDRRRKPAAAELCSRCKHPLVVGLTTSADRLIQVRRNRLLSLNQAPETAYVDQEAVTREVAFARRMFADNGWPVIDVTRRSIEETAAAIISSGQRARAARAAAMRLILASQSASRRAMLDAAGVPFEAVAAAVDEDAAKAALRAEAVAPRDLADALAELKALKVSQRDPEALVLGSDSLVALADGTLLDKPVEPRGCRRASARACRAARTICAARR